MPNKPVQIVYRGENGPGWAPASRRAVWNYGVRTGQIVVPALDDGGPADGPYDDGDVIDVAWVPPEYGGNLREVAPPPQPTYFELSDEAEATTDDE